MKRRRRSFQQAPLCHSELEPRHLLSADFSFSGSVLTINNFDNADSDISVAQNSVSINGGTAEDAYIFTLASGSFDESSTFTLPPTIDFHASGNTLIIGTAGLGGASGSQVLVDGQITGSTDFVELTQSGGQVEFGSFQLTNFENSTNSLQLNLAGDVELDNVLVSSTANNVLSVTTDGNIEVAGIVSNTASLGNINLTTTGGLSSITVDAAIQATDGDINIAADDNVNLSASVQTGGGDVVVSADPDGDCNGSITMTDGSVINAGSGDITLDADENINLGGLNTSGTVNVTSNDGGIIDGGNIATDIVAGTANLTAATGIGDADEIEIQVNTISANNTISGEIDLLQLATGGDIDVQNLSNVGLGSIALVANGGTINVGGAGASTEGGAVNLIAVGTGSDVQIDSQVIASSGPVVIDAQNDVIVTSQVVGGDVEIEADSDGDGDGAITMADGALIDAGGGDITLEAAEDINVGGLNTSGTVNVTSTAGGIIDGGDIATDIVAGTANLTAATGIGDADEIEIQVDTVSAANTTSGDIDLLQESVGEDINVLNLDNDALAANGGNITLATEGGTINVLASGSGIEAEDGTVTLDADGADSDVVVNNTITTTAGDVAIAAEGDVVFTAAGDVATSGGDVTVSADADGDGNGAITMADGAVVDSGSGTITFEAAENITLGGLTTTSSLAPAISLTTDGDVLDGGDTDIDLSAANGTILIRASNVGVDGAADFFKVEAASINAIETFSSMLDVVATGAVAINELNPLSNIINLTSNTAFLTSVGDLTFTDPTPTVSSLALLVGGTLTLPGTLTVAGDLRIDAADVDGSINLTADRLLFISGEAEVLMTEVNQLDVQSAGDLTVTNLGDLELVDLDCNHIAAQSLSGDLVINATAGVTPGDLMVTDDVIAGALNDNNSAGTILLTSDGDTFIDDVVLSDVGSIQILSDQNLTVSTSGIVTSTTGNISLEADVAPGNNGGFILMEDNGVNEGQVIAGRATTSLYDPDDAVTPNIDLGTSTDGGTISLAADGNIDISSLQTTSNSFINPAVQISSTSGAVLDNGDISTDIIANSPNALTSINAATGIGDANALEVQSDTVSASNTSSGDIDLVERTAGGPINVLNLDNDATAAAGGDITLTSEDGTINVLASGQGIEAEDGTVTLDANGATSDALVNNTITTSSGDVDLAADRDVANNAQITTGGGKLDVAATNDVLVNNTITTSGGDVTVTAGGDLTATAAISIDADLELTAEGTLVADSLEGENVTVFSGEDAQINTVIANAGSLWLNSSRSLDVGQIQASADVTLDAGIRITADSIVAGNMVSANAGAFLSTQSVEATDVTLTAGTNQVAQRVIADTALITAEANLGVNDIQAIDLIIEAGDDIYDAQWLDGIGIKTENLSVRAGNNTDDDFNGILLETDVSSLTASVDGEFSGDIVIRELDDITLGDIEIDSGMINILAQGTIFQGNINNRTENVGNLVRLNATGAASDVLVNRIDVGNSGRVFLIAGDDVVTSATQEQNVKADFLFVNSQNGSSDTTESIALATDVDSVRLAVGSEGDPDPARGDISIVNERDLFVSFARTFHGKVDISASGELVTQTVVAAGLTDDDSIRLTASGEGADLVINRVAVLDRTGGIVLTADDDVRDADTEDDLNTVANNLTIIAGNNLNDAFSGINIQSRVLSVDASVLSGDATLSIFNGGMLTVDNASLNSGSVHIVNQFGFLTVNNVSFTELSVENGVFLNTTGGDFSIAVGRIDAGESTIIIDSADDILDTDSSDDNFLTGNFVRAISRNGDIDSFDGIILTVDVDGFAADAQQGGQEFVRQLGS